MWNKKIDKLFKEIGLSQSNYDTCVYFYRRGDKVIILAMYVDDILAITNDKNLLDHVKKMVFETFKARDLGELKKIFGVRVIRNRERSYISLDQEEYINSILQKLSMLDCNPSAIPMEVGLKLKPDTTTKTKEEYQFLSSIPYRQAVGSLMFLLQATRPDLAFALSTVSQFNDKYTEVHWNAVKRILKYLKNTSNYGLFFRKDQVGQIVGYSDASHAGNHPVDTKSTTGYIFQFQKGTISWNSKKQPSTALSSTEAEYRALVSATREGIWIKHFVEELFNE